MLAFSPTCIFYHGKQQVTRLVVRNHAASPSPVQQFFTAPRDNTTHLCDLRQLHETHLISERQATYIPAPHTPHSASSPGRRPSHHRIPPTRQIQVSRSPKGEGLNPCAYPHGALAGASGRVGPRPLAASAPATAVPVVYRSDDLIAARRRLQFLERRASVLA